MEELYIIPGACGDALSAFLENAGVKQTGASAEGFTVRGSLDAIVSALCNFFLERRLTGEALDALRPRSGAQSRADLYLCERAARRAVEGVRFDVERALRRYLEVSGSIHLDGFWRFRLRAEREEVRGFAQICALQLEEEERYRDFVMLLQSYVQSAVPLLDSVLLLADAAGRHHLFEPSGKEITYEYADLEGVDGPQNEDDVILSSLMTVAPRRIYLCGGAQSANPHLLDTVRKIFCVYDVAPSFTFPLPCPSDHG